MLLEATAIPPERLLLLLIPLAVVWFTLRRRRTGLEHRLVNGILRSTVQLSALGFVLGPLFGLGRTPLVFLVLAGMCALAAFFSLGLLGKGPGLRLWPQAVAAILPMVVGLTMFALGLIVPERSVIDARYAISFAGMMAGVSMNSVALAGERFLTGLQERRSEVELKLLFGGTAHEATRELAASAVRVAVTPSLNSLIAVGLVSIPGMMSGQVIAGGDPLVAARYQIVVMSLWVTAAALAPSLFLLMLPRRVMADHRLEGPPEGADRPGFRLKDLPPLPVIVEAPAAFDSRQEAAGGPEVFGEPADRDRDSG